jgi:predicted transcriptional regulator
MVTKRQELQKEQIMESLKRLSEDATLGDFIHYLSYLYGIEQGLADVDAGRTISHEELLERIKGWRDRGAERGGTDSAKAEVIRSLARLPEDASAEDIEYRVYVVLKVLRAFAESAAGNKVSHEEARERLKHWLE